MIKWKLYKNDDKIIQLMDASINNISEQWIQWLEDENPHLYGLLESSLQQFIGRPLEKEITEMLAKEIRQEVDNQLLKELKS